MAPRAICVLFIFNACAVVASIASPLLERSVGKILENVTTSQLKNLTSGLHCHPQNGQLNGSAVLLVKVQLRLAQHVHNKTNGLDNLQMSRLSHQQFQSIDRATLVIRDDEAYFRIPVSCSETAGGVTPTDLTSKTSVLEQQNGGSSGLSDWASAGIITAIILGVCLVVFAIIVDHKKRQKQFIAQQNQTETDEREARRHQMERHFELKQMHDPGCYDDERSQTQALSPEIIAPHMALVRQEWGADMESCLIPKESITLGREIGRGAFGKVLVGSVSKTENEREKYIPVAIKTLKHAILPSDIDEFLKEALVMKDFNHPNVVALIGVCMEGDEPPLVCLEFMHYGDLRSFLRRSRDIDNPEITKEYQLPPVPPQQLFDFCIDVAQGMAYLARRDFVHRDLACRNCMINQDKVVKIGDFGLARDIHEDHYYRMGTVTRLPAKWMAFESLVDRVFTSASDVWSYGVVMWEIFTLGQSPYPSVPNHMILDHLNNGKRLTLPDDSPAHSIYPIMASCWSRDKKQRPSFIDLIVRLKEYRDNFYVNLAVRTREDIEYQNINPKISATGRVDSVGGYSYAGSQGRAGSTVPIKRTNSYVSTPQGTANTLPVQESSPSPTGDIEESFNPGYDFVQPITGEENGCVIPLSSIMV